MRERWGAIRLDLAGQAERVFPWLVVAFGAGIALFFTWRDDPSPTVTVGLCIGGIALLPMRRKVPWLSALAAMVLAVGLGHAAAQWRTARVATPLLERESRPFTLTATVVSAEKRPGGNRIVVEDFSLPDTPPAQTPRRLRITVPASHGIPAVGSRISVRAVVRPAAVPVMPDGFQFQRFLYASRKNAFERDA